MRAVRWHARADVRVEDIPAPGPPRPGWVRMDIEACGICGTDVEEYTNGPVVVNTEPNELSGQCAPLVLGHEAVGVITDIGDGVELAIGSRVAVEGNLFCRRCFWCLRGEYQLCVSLASLGLMADGGLAERLLAPSYMCIPFGNHLRPEHAAFAEPLSVAVRAVRRAGIEPGSSVGVIGTGTIGLLAIQAARLAGATTIVAVERYEERRRLALKLGADLAVVPEQAAEASLDVTGGVGLEVVIEAAGNPGASAFAVRLTRRGGRAVLLGLFDGPLTLDMKDMLLGEKSVLTSLSHVYDVDFTRAVDLLDRGLVEVEPLITARIGLAEVVTMGFERLVAEPGAHLKMIVMPSKDCESDSDRGSAEIALGG